MIRTYTNPQEREKEDWWLVVGKGLMNMIRVGASVR